MAESSRADAELVRRGLARSRRHAVQLVAAGRVAIAGRVVTKPSVPVDQRSEIVVTPHDEDDYASRAGTKLAGALDVLDRRIRVDGAYCADLGASTGGFTDVLLIRGARHVVALDVGHGQLLRRLREDPRVTAVEGKNVRDLAPEDLAHAPDLVTGDLSFISLTLVLPALARVLRPGGDALLLVKPQFEVGRERLGKGGVVRDPALHARAITTVAGAGADAGLRWRGVVPSPLPGPAGNREFFTWFTADGDAAAAGATVSDDATMSGGATASDVATASGAPRARAGEPRPDLARIVADAVVPGSAVRLYGPAGNADAPSDDHRHGDEPIGDAPPGDEPTNDNQTQDRDDSEDGNVA